MQEIGYLGLFFYSLGGGFFAMAAGAVFAALGKLDPILVFIIGALANYLGDCLLFFGIKWNREFYQPTITQYRRTWAYARLLSRKQGDWVIFIQKYLPTVKAIVPLSLGISSYPVHKFLLLQLPATLLWAGIVFAVFYLLGESGEAIVLWFENWGWIVPLSVIILLAVFFLYLRHKGVFGKKRRK